MEQALSAAMGDAAEQQAGQLAAATPAQHDYLD